MATPMSLFKALHDGKRDAQRRAEHAMPFGIFPLRKDGSLYATPTATAATREAAEVTAARLRELNPGRTYEIVAK